VEDCEQRMKSFCCMVFKQHCFLFRFWQRWQLWCCKEKKWFSQQNKSRLPKLPYFCYILQGKQVLIAELYPHFVFNNLVRWRRDNLW